jgi:GxxExxY protein
MKEDDIGTLVIKTAISIHKQLGPGLLEAVYEAILAQELRNQGLKVECQVPVPIKYGDLKFEEGFRADLVIENMVILELKSVETTNNAHKKQLLTYLRLTGMKVGYLLNFGEELMKTGITRTINGFNN